ncbi:MarR family winged helix-turn-helix transcriptional regulator [Roseateles sp. BYS180W]|uniref:MarR family winged helix-turn-helix transcriptional regulator n=1 Tax=Roseateles rivi TaxID=3299028 RepID=A0ABW7FYU9_9BURK
MDVSEATPHPSLPLDVETRAAESDHQTLRLWLRLLACTTRVEDEIRSRLRTQFGTTLPRFDLMAQLERHPQGLTMRELSGRMMVTGGNITGITDQLEAEGLVQRQPHPADRRAFSVRLTPAGRRVFRRMAATHELWIQELLGGWDAPRQQQVYQWLAELKDHLNAAASVPPQERSTPRGKP